MEENERIFFVVGTGRCGTLWLSKFLNTSDIAVVHHERLGTDRDASEIASEEESEEYIRIRVPLIKIELLEKHYYGEVNSYMLFHINALRSVLGAKVSLLVRDGRNVVRSRHSRDTLLGEGPGKFLNPEDDARFEKLCWLWNWQNQLALSRNVEAIIFERLLEDWAYFNSFFGFLEIDKHAWESSRKIRENASAEHRLPEYQYWEPERRAIFDKHCGRLMDKLGYI